MVRIVRSTTDDDILAVHGPTQLLPPSTARAANFAISTADPNRSPLHFIMVHPAQPVPVHAPGAVDVPEHAKAQKAFSVQESTASHHDVFRTYRLLAGNYPFAIKDTTMVKKTTAGENMTTTTNNNGTEEPHNATKLKSQIETPACPQLERCVGDTDKASLIANTYGKKPFLQALNFPPGQAPVIKPATYPNTENFSNSNATTPGNACVFLFVKPNANYPAARNATPTAPFAAHAIAQPPSSSLCVDPLPGPMTFATL